MARRFLHLALKGIVTFNTKKKRLTVGKHAVIDQKAIYVRVIGLLVGQRDLNFQEVLARKLTAYHRQTSASSPRNMAEEVPYAPEQILKLVKCG